jgi:hypothetical protein
MLHLLLSLNLKRKFFSGSELRERKKKTLKFPLTQISPIKQQKKQHVLCLCIIDYFLFLCSLLLPIPMKLVVGSFTCFYSFFCSSVVGKKNQMHISLFYLLLTATARVCGEFSVRFIFGMLLFS